MFLSQLLVKMAVFRFSQKCSSPNRNFESFNFQNNLSLLLFIFSLAITNASDVVSCVRRKVRLSESGGMAHTPKTVPTMSPCSQNSGLSSLDDQVLYNKLTNRIRNSILFTSPQLAACHKWHHKTSPCLLKFSQNMHHEECPG